MQSGAKIDPFPNSLASSFVGIKNVEIDMAGQKVTVETDIDMETLLATISKTGKATTYAGQAD